MRIKIQRLNSLISAQFNARENATWLQSLNVFHDMTYDEWYETKQEISGDKDGGEKLEIVMDDSTVAPASFDWRTKGIASKTRDQGNCAGSHAIAVVNAIESHYQIRTGENISLSTQEIIDCVDKSNEK